MRNSIELAAHHALSWLAAEIELLRLCNEMEQRDAESFS